MSATVWCHYCNKSSHYLDDVDFDFTCKHCGKHNDDGTFKRELD